MLNVNFKNKLKKIIPSALGVICIVGCAMFGCDINRRPATDDSESADSSFSRPPYISGSTVNMVSVDDAELSDYLSMPLSEVISRVETGVVSVEVESTGGTKTYASGVVIGNSEDEKFSYIVISHHIIVGASSVKVYVGKDDKTGYFSTAVGTDPQTDLCVIRIEKKLPAAAFYTEEPLVGTKVLSVADALGNKSVVSSTGIVSMRNYAVDVGEGKYSKYMLTDAYVGTYSSGGGLFTESGGLLIGILRYGLDQKGWQGYALPAETVKEVCTEIIEKGYVEGRYKLGFTVENSRTSWGITESIKVTDVSTDGSFYAKGNGLRKDDIIESFFYNDEEKITYEVTKAENLYAYFYDAQYGLAGQLKVGDEITFYIERNGTKMSVKVEILQYDYFRHNEVSSAF